MDEMWCSSVRMESLEDACNIVYLRATPKYEKRALFNPSFQNQSYKLEHEMLPFTPKWNRLNRWCTFKPVGTFIAGGEAPHVGKTPAPKRSLVSQGKKNFGLDMRLTSRNLVSSTLPLFWVSPFDRKRRSLSLAKLPSWIGVDMGFYTH